MVEIPEMTRKRLTFAAALMLLSLETLATPVVVGDNEWRQLTETTGFSWNEIATVCDPDSGACNGVLGEVDFSSWTWASTYDVLDNLLSPLTPLTYSYGTFDHESGETAWATEFTTLFNPTLGNSSFAGVIGALRTTIDHGSYVAGQNAYLYDYFDNSNTRDRVSTYGWSLFDYATEFRGVWLYRTATPVAEPPVLLLIGIGLLSLAIRRRAGAAGQV